MKLKLRINPIEGIIMTLLALFYDGLQALVEAISAFMAGWLINPFITFWSFLTFTFWFKLKGVKFLKPNKIATMGGSNFFEFIPLVNSLPTLTFGVIMTLAIVYAEDVVGAISPLAAQALGAALGNFKKGGKMKVMSAAAAT